MVRRLADTQCPRRHPRGRAARLTSGPVYQDGFATLSTSGQRSGCDEWSCLLREGFDDESRHVSALRL